MFFVHPMGGNVLCYLPLAEHLPADQPFHALQAAGGDAGTEPVPTVHALAQSYLEAIRRVQPHGPYTLGGWSFGGFVAFEMARLLREAGEEVANLFLLDTVALNLGERTRATDDALLGWFFWELLWLERGGASPLDAIPVELDSLDARFDFIAARAVDLGVLPQGSSGAIVRRLFAVYATNWQSALDYRIGVLDVDVTLIHATEALPHVLAEMHSAAGSQHRDPRNGWGGTTTARLHTVDVSGDHLTIMEEPHVRVVAKTIADLVNSTESRIS